MTSKILRSLPPPHPSTHLTWLLGVPKSPDDSTRDELYTSQLATLVWWQCKSAGWTARLPVVVSLAFADKDSKHDRDGDGMDDDDTTATTTGVTTSQRHLFASIMGMLAEWNPPSLS